MKEGALKTIATGLLAGFVGNGVLGALFASPPIRTILYNPKWQSLLFIDVTPKRNLPVSVAGLVVLSVIHAWLFKILRAAIPGGTWLHRGFFWGVDLVDVLAVSGMVYLPHPALGALVFELARTYDTAFGFAG